MKDPFKAERAAAQAELNKEVTLSAKQMRTIVDAVKAQIAYKKDGKDGKDGVVDYDLVYKYIESQVRAFTSKVKVPKDGRNGRDGRDGNHGRDGQNGRDGTTVTQENVLKLVQQVVAQLPNKGYIISKAEAEKLIDRRVSDFHAKLPRGQFSGNAASLRQIPDANLDNLEQDEQGNYLLGSGAGNSVIRSDTAPSDPDDGQLWMDTSERFDLPVTSADITSIVSLTQAQYDALTPDSGTFYLITS